MNKLNAFQVEKLIQLIQESPVIFDKGDINYKHVSIKDKTWEYISDMVGAEESECKTAWKSLRTQFVKAVNENNTKPGKKLSEKKTYKYYDQLLFLKGSIRKRKKSSNFDELIEECDVLLYDDDTEMFEKNEDIVIEPNKAPSISNTSTPRSTASPRPSKRLKADEKSQDHAHFKEFLNAIVTEIKTPNQTTQDDIQTFFNVVANMIRNANLTRFQNRQVQRKVFNFVAEELDKLDNDEANK